MTILTTTILTMTILTMTILTRYGAQLGAALIFGPIRCLQWACYFQVRSYSTDCE